jgi:hypothetical protein
MGWIGRRIQGTMTITMVSIEVRLSTGILTIRIVEPAMGSANISIFIWNHSLIPFEVLSDAWHRLTLL